MTTTIKSKYLIIAVIGLITAIFFFGWYVGRKNANSVSDATILVLNGQIDQYSTEINDKEVYIYEKDQEILSLKFAIERGDIEKKELKALNIKQANEITRLKLKVDTLFDNVEHSGKIIKLLREELDSIDILDSEPMALMLPFTFHKKDTWLDLRGAFDMQGKLDINLKVNANVDVWTVVKKKEKLPVTIITTDNPYIGIIGIRSQKFDMQKVKRWGLGPQIGYGIPFSDMVKFRPYIGIGIHYSLFLF